MSEDIGKVITENQQALEARAVLTIAQEMKVPFYFTLRGVVQHFSQHGVPPDKILEAVTVAVATLMSEATASADLSHMLRLRSNLKKVFNDHVAMQSPVVKPSVVHGNMPNGQAN